LQIIGTQLCDAQGTPVQLKGMSTMGLQWYGGIINKAAFTALAKDWQCDVIRLAFYIGENGYATHPALKTLLVKGIGLALQTGMYVIIDWHVLNPGNPDDPVYKGATAFFDEISKRFGNYPHIIYEIMNEPNGAARWDNGLKAYAEKMVATIRANDPDNIILIGSGSWSQDVDLASLDPVAGTNLMYTFHFYAGTHGATLRSKVANALKNGVAVFCSEWGTSASNGNGGPFLDRADEWLSFLDQNKISWVNWSLCNKNEASAAFNAISQEFKAGKTVTTQHETPLEPNVAGPAGYPIWPIRQLSLSGNYVRAKIKGSEIPSRKN
jgi:endoglucanase